MVPSMHHRAHLIKLGLYPRNNPGFPFYVSHDASILAAHRYPSAAPQETPMARAEWEALDR
jgi:hypothetical protein